MKKYKVIKEYTRFYLAESPSGYRECFSKNEYKPNCNGEIVKKKEYNYKGGITLSDDKVNKSFNNTEMF